MIEGFPGTYSMDSDDDDGNELQIWDCPDEPCNLRPSPTSKSRAGYHSTQWTAPNFRPGTAPEVTIFHGSDRRAYAQSKDLSSPPTTLSETNFALKMAARTSYPVGGSSRESPNFSRTSLKKRAVEKSRRSSDAARAYSGTPSKPSTSEGKSGARKPESPYVVNADTVNYSPKASSSKPSTPLSTQRSVLDAALSCYMPHGGKAFKPPVANSRECDTPPTSSSSSRPNTKQRKAASARVSRQPVQRNHPVFNPSKEEGDGLFQKREEYPQRPPSRHREPGQSLGLDVHPEPKLRLRSAHFPSHHERPPSRCKPPNQALHLEDKLLEDGQTPAPVASPTQSPGTKGRGTPVPERVTGWDMPGNEPEVIILEDSQEKQEEPVKEIPSPDREDIVPSAEDTKRREWSAGLQRPAAPSTKHKPTGKPHIAQVPFRTSLSPDFLCLFAPTGENNAPANPTLQVGLEYNNNGLLHSSLFSDCFSMGMSDIPSPEDDPFESRRFEDLCISEDESESD